MTDQPRAATVIDVWTVPDGSQPDVVSALNSLYELLILRDGFIEGAIYESKDRTRIISWSRYRSARELQGALDDPTIAAVTRKLRGLAHQDLHEYEPIHVFAPSSLAESGRDARRD